MMSYRALCHNRPVISMIGRWHDSASTSEVSGPEPPIAERRCQGARLGRKDDAAICQRQVPYTSRGGVRVAVAFAGAVMTARHPVWDRDSVPAGIRVITLICKQCRKELFRDATIKGLKPKYCSTKCEKEGQRSLLASYKTVRKICETCKKEFFCDRWKAPTKRYCTERCHWKSRQLPGGYVMRPCSTCGKEVRRRAYRPTVNVYCGYECMAKGKVTNAPRTNKWANVRTWFGRFGRMSKCERCEYCEEPKILVLHHKDRNRDNNHLGNLEVLCPNCHAKEHLAEHKNGWKGHQSKNPTKIALRQQTQERKSAP